MLKKRKNEVVIFDDDSNFHVDKNCSHIGRFYFFENKKRNRLSRGRLHL